jgi:hypothetical protein
VKARVLLRQFVAACDADEQRLVATMVLTGMRRGDVRFDLGMLFIHAKEVWTLDPGASHPLSGWVSGTEFATGF